MKALFALGGFVALFLSLAALLTAGWERPPIQVEQLGYRGLGMEQLTNPRTTPPVTLPEPIAPVPAAGPPASTVFKNVPLFGHLTAGEFTRSMLAITAWVSPKEGCNYCHVPDDMASEAPYAKVVARKMVEMTQHINSAWKSHVGETGVTCYTCHRGEPVPAGVWFFDPGPATAKGMAGNRAGQNAPARQVGLTSLPYDPFSSYLLKGEEIRVASVNALPVGRGASIQATEATYALMMHVSASLGVNCTYCHNTRSFFDWDASTPARATAWHGIRMVRELNAKYLEPVAAQLPAERLGPSGDGPKVSCLTCHQGAAKPLGGAAMLKDHPELAAPAKR